MERPGVTSEARKVPVMVPPRGVRVILVEDHPVVREGLRAVLQGEPGMLLVGESGGGPDVLHLVREVQPDAILMDIHLPGVSGIDLTRQIHEAHPAVKIILLTVYDSELYFLEALKAGAAGYLVKGAPKDLIVLGIQAAMQGGMVVQREVVVRALGSVARTESPLEGVLTSREVEVLRQIALGASNKSIAASLHVAEVTVKKYVQAMLRKLRVTDRTQAALMAVRLGLVD